MWKAKRPNAFLNSFLRRNLFFNFLTFKIFWLKPKCLVNFEGIPYITMPHLDDFLELVVSTVKACRVIGGELSVNCSMRDDWVEIVKKNVRCWIWWELKGNYSLMIFQMKLSDKRCQKSVVWEENQVLLILDGDTFVIARYSRL